MERSRKMMTWITGRTGVNREDMPVCMEHAGIYLLTFQCLFEEDGIAYTMVSLLHLKKSLGLARGKNDRIDDLRIVDFCCTHWHKLRPDRLPSDSLQQLKRLIAERDRDVNQKRILEQPKTGMGQFETRSRTLKMLREAVTFIEEIEEEMLTVIQKDEAVNQNYILLTGITGTGSVNAVNIIIHTCNFEAFDNAR